MDRLGSFQVTLKSHLPRYQEAGGADPPRTLRLGYDRRRARKGGVPIWIGWPGYKRAAL